MTSIDLNCDCGEAEGSDAEGQELAVLEWVSSANIACGAHGGSLERSRRLIAICAERGIASGAHPGWPDRAGRGRRELDWGAERVYSLVLEQLGALAGLAAAEGQPLYHVKPHGALYHQAARDPELADAIARAVVEHDPRLVLVGLAGSELPRRGLEHGLTVAHEAFADRAYEADGSLTPRSHRGALLKVADARRQVRSLVRDGGPRTRDGQLVALAAETLCLHGDTPDAPAIAAAVREALAGLGVEVRRLTGDPTCAGP